MTKNQFKEQLVVLMLVMFSAFALATTKGYADELSNIHIDQQVNINLFNVNEFEKHNEDIELPISEEEALNIANKFINSSKDFITYSGLFENNGVFCYKFEITKAIKDNEKLISVIFINADNKEVYSVKSKSAMYKVKTLTTQEFFIYKFPTTIKPREIPNFIHSRGLKIKLL